MQTLFQISYNAVLTPHLIWKNVEFVERDARARLQKIFSQSNVALSCDDWTSPSSIGFCNVVATVQNTTRSQYSLGLIYLEKTDGFSIAEEIVKRVSSFGIKSKFITTDGATNMGTMSRHANLNQQKCLIHGLQLIVTEMIFTKKDKFGFPVLETDEGELTGLDPSSAANETNEAGRIDEISNTEKDPQPANVVDAVPQADIFQTREGKVILKPMYQNAIKQVRSLMVLLKRSTKQRGFLRQYTKLSPILDVPTNWNSTLNMLQRFIEINNDLKKASLDSSVIEKKND